MSKPVDLEQFLALPTSEVAEIVRDSGTKTCVFPFNGTRRWFLLEHGDSIQGDPAKAYIEATTGGYIRLFKMLFDHGIETVIAPVFGSEILLRGEEYMTQIGASMGLLGEHPEFVSFYDQYHVRVQFYGDYRREFEGGQYQSILNMFDKVTAATASGKKHRLFYGVFASDATQSIAELSVRFFQENGRVPTRNELVEIYYGALIEKADLFIGFEKFSVFDYPMLNWGEENLYFTIAPSLYMTDVLLRKILYDCIFLRPLAEPDYSHMPKEQIDLMRKTYLQQKDNAFGVGVVRNGIWYAENIL